MKADKKVSQLNIMRQLNKMTCTPKREFDVGWNAAVHAMIDRLLVGALDVDVEEEHEDETKT